MNDWDIISPLADLNDLLAGADSGSYDLEDILAEFGKPLEPSEETDKPKIISEKKPPDIRTADGEEVNRAKPEEQDVARPEAAGGMLRQKTPSDVPHWEETGEEMRSGALKKAAAFSSIVSLRHKKTAWAGKRLSQSVKPGQKDVLPRTGDLNQYEAPQTEIKPEPIPENVHPEQETEAETLREEEIRMEAEPAQINEAEPADIDQKEVNQEACPEPEADEETATAAPHKTGLFASLRNVLEQADEYAQNMYPDETDTEAEEAEEAEEPEEPEEFDVRAWEEGKKKISGKRRPLRPAPPPEPERPPEDMVKRYAKGLSGLRFRLYVVFFLCLALCYIVFCEKYQLPLPGGTQNRFAYGLFTSLVLECAAAILGLHVLIEGVRGLIRLQIGFNTLIVFSVIASLADGLCLLTLGYRAQSLPFWLVAQAQTNQYLPHFP